MFKPHVTNNEQPKLIPPVLTLVNLPESEPIPPEEISDRSIEVIEEEVEVNQPVLMPNNNPVSHLVILLSEPFDCEESIEDLVTQEALFEFDFRMLTSEIGDDIDDTVAIEAEFSYICMERETFEESIDDFVVLKSVFEIIEMEKSWNTFCQEELVLPVLKASKGKILMSCVSDEIEVYEFFHGKPLSEIVSFDSEELIMYSDGRRRIKKRPKVVAPIEKFFRDHGSVAKTHLLPFLFNMVPNRNVSRDSVELTDRFAPGLHVFKVSLLSKVMRRVSERMYWPKKPEKFAKDSTINRFVEMLYSKPDFLEP